jgi:hypothetical protein
MKALLYPFAALALICAFERVHAATPDVSSETAQRLAALEKGFQEAADREAGAAFKASMETVNKSYAAAVDRALAVAMQAGKTDDALALRDERKRIEKGDPMPPEGVAESGEVASLRKTYRTALKQQEAVRAMKVIPLFDKYTQALGALAVELTKAGKLDDAAGVKAVADEVAKARASGNVSSSTSFAAGTRRLTGLERSFTNSLGMKFVPVPGTKVMFCIHETRRKDYAVYAAASGRMSDAWAKPVRDGTPVGTGSDDEPVVLV